MDNNSSEKLPRGMSAPVESVEPLITSLDKNARVKYDAIETATILNAILGCSEDIASKISIENYSLISDTKERILTVEIRIGG